MPAPLFQDPQAATAIQLLQQPGEYRARALSEIANAQASAQVQGAQAWAGGIQGVANTVAQLPQQVQQQQAAQQEHQLKQQQIAANKRAADQAALVDDTKRRINALAGNPEVFNEDGTFNAKALQAKLGQVTPGVQGPNQAPDLTTLFGILDPINESYLKARQAKATWETDKANHIAKVAGGAIQYARDHGGDFFTPAQLGLAQLQKSGWLTEKELNEYVVPMVEHPEQLPAMLEALASRTTQAPIKLGDREQLISPVDYGKVLAAGPGRDPQNETALWFDSVDPRSPTREISRAALAAQPGKAIPLNELLYKAIQEGDEQKKKNVLQAIREDALAKHVTDPATAVNKALQEEMLRARLDKMKEDAAPIDVTPQLQTSLINPEVKYIDSSTYATAHDREKARKSAEALGVAFLNKDQAAGIVAADRAASNLDTQWQTVRALFPKGAGDRLLGGAENTLKKLFQTNPDLGAYDSWRAAAIQAIQAIAEQRAGLRLNQVEIATMIAAIPKITDAAPTAEKKLLSIGALLKTKVNSLLIRDRSTLRVKGGLLAPADETDTTDTTETPREPIKRTPVTATPPAVTPPPIVPPPTGAGSGAGARGPVIRRPVGGR